MKNNTKRMNKEKNDNMLNLSFKQDEDINKYFMHKTIVG